MHRVEPVKPVRLLLSYFKPSTRVVDLYLSDLMTESLSVVQKWTDMIPYSGE